MTAAPVTGVLTRLTLVARQRRVDLVLPSESPLGELMPEIVQLLGYHPAELPQSYRVSLFDGRTVGFDQSLRSAGVLDGALLRVDRIGETPMPSVVHDVTDEVADDLESRTGRWGATARRWTATAVIAAAAVFASLLAAGALPAPLLSSVGASALLAGAVVALAGARTVGTAVLLAGASVAATSVPFWLAQWPLRWLAWLLLLAVTVLAAGAGNERLRAGAIGAGALLGLLGLWVVFSALGLPAAQVASLLAVASTVTLGQLPRLALTMSGLTRLDDQQVSGRAAARTSVRAAVDAAHRGLALAVVFAGASAALAGWILAQAGNAWATALAILLAIGTWLRTRACPLTIEVLSLNAATLVVIAGLVRHQIQGAPALWWGGVLVAVAVIGLGFVALSYRPPAHVRARARQVGDLVESLSVVAMVPVAVGVFGIYERLLNTF